MPNDISIADRVAAGVAYLDQLEADPNWWVGRIDVDRLDIAHVFNCVLGQIYGSYGTALLFTWDFDSLAGACEAAISMGFTTVGVRMEARQLLLPGGMNTYLAQVADTTLEMQELTAQWRQVVEQRQQQLACAFMARVRADIPELVAA